MDWSCLIDVTGRHSIGLHIPMLRPSLVFFREVLIAHPRVIMLLAFPCTLD